MKCERAPNRRNQNDVLKSWKGAIEIWSVVSKSFRMIEIAVSTMKKLFLTGIAALLLATGTAHAQCDFFGPGGGCVNAGQQYNVRPIKISPTTSRTYSPEADYRPRHRSKTAS